MATWNRFLIAIIAVVVFVVASEKRNFRFVFDTVVVKHWAPDLVEELNFTMTQQNNRSLISGHLILKRIIDNLYVNTTMDFWKDGKDKRRLYNLQTDACQFLTMVHKSHLLNIFAKSFQKHTSGKLVCPLKAVSLMNVLLISIPFPFVLYCQYFNYTLNNWFLNEEDFPNYVPRGIFQTITEYLVNKKKTFRILARGQVINNK